jgi:hypothetical protein
MILISREKSVLLIRSKQVQYMKENGREVLEMVRVLRDGQMVPHILVSGKRTELMARASSSMLMAMSMKASGPMTKPMALVSTGMSMELAMKVNGKMTCNMEKVWKAGLTGQSMKVITLLEENMVLEPINGTMALSTQENGMKTKSLD